MDRSDVITLVKETTARDDFGIFQTTTTERDVFAQVDSITQTEFYEAGRNGLNPEIRFTVFLYDYDGERVVVYEGSPYAVYRTYRGRDDTMELYCERKGGTNGTTDAG